MKPSVKTILESTDKAAIIKAMDDRTAAKLAAKVLKENNPAISSRQLELRTGLPYRTASRVVKPT